MHVYSNVTLMHIRDIPTQREWDAFVLNCPAAKTFLHSWQWGELHTRQGSVVHRIGLEEQGRLVGVALLLTIRARRGSFLFCPHGPMLSDWQWFPSFAEYMIARARDERMDFVRMSPLVEKLDFDISLFRHIGFRPAPMHMHAETTWTLDLAPSEEALVSGMKKTMRNLVRRGSKDGVTVRFGVTQDLIGTFYELHERTVRLQDFVPFSKSFIKQEVDVFSPDNIIVAIAYHDGVPLAGAVVPIYGGVGYYHHGASLHSKVPASYVLQWEIIRELKRRGCAQYNFWGIAPTDDPKHSWHGLSQFKMGFGGYRTDYVHAQDYPLTWKYWLNYAVETARRIKRGY